MNYFTNPGILVGGTLAYVLLGKHINTIYLWIQRGSLPAERQR